MKKEQQYGNSCGAASLLCAAMELGVLHLPNLGGRNYGQPLRADFYSEAALYQITSGAVTGGRKKTADLGKLGYSFPHNVAIAARELGLTVRIYMSGTVASLLSTFYPEAEANCWRTGFRVIHAKAPPLRANQRALKVMTTFGIGLHYVMQRPNGTFMDPAEGDDFASFEAMNGWSKFYRDTLICLVLERGLPSDT